MEKILKHYEAPALYQHWKDVNNMNAITNAHAALTNTGDTREAWLQRAASAMQTWLMQETGQMQPTVHVSVGFAGGKCKLDKVLGACFAAEYSADGNPHIFISPITQGAPAGAQGVLATLLHELIHASIAPYKGHGKKFQAVAGPMGLQAPWKATSASQPLMARMQTLADSLGIWDHASLAFPDVEKQRRRVELLLGDKLGKEARIIIPSQDRDGLPLHVGFLSTILQEAAQLFGGYTTWIASGGWVSPIGGYMEEVVQVVDIAAPSDPKCIARLEAFALEIRDKGNQWNVYLRLPTGTVELVGEKE